MTNNNIIEARIIKKYSSQFILLYENQEFVATTKSKRTNFVVGDLVQAEIAENKQARILDLLPRKSLLFRSDHNRSKLIASNITQVFIVISSQPRCNLQFLNACLIFCESQYIRPVVVVNKNDLDSHKEFYESIHGLYQEKLKYQVVSVNAICNIDILNQLLEGNATVLIGQSGVGKSTIISRILSLEIRAGGLSSNGKGCHTTTSATMYQIDDHSSIIDSPGLDNFGINQINPYDLSRCFVDFLPYIPLCKFRNCLHLNEPECAVLKAVSQDQIDPARYKSYLTFLQIIST